MLKVKCEVCGKPDLDKHGDFCYGCGHIVCTDCCTDIDGFLLGGHNIRTHRKEFWKKVGLGRWQSVEGES